MKSYFSLKNSVYHMCLPKRRGPISTSTSQKKKKGSTSTKYNMLSKQSN